MLLPFNLSLRKTGSDLRFTLSFSLLSIALISLEFPLLSSNRSFSFVVDDATANAALSGCARDFRQKSFSSSAFHETFSFHSLLSPSLFPPRLIPVGPSTTLFPSPPVSSHRCALETAVHFSLPHFIISESSAHLCSSLPPTSFGTRRKKTKMKVTLLTNK